MNTRWWLVSLALAAASIGCRSSASSKSNDGEAAEHARASAPALMIQYGCPTCHVIPGVPGAVGKVGPSLDSLAQRTYLAGVLPNSSQNLEHWLMHPQSIHPGTAMPEMGVTELDVQTMALYFQSDR